MNASSSTTLRARSASRIVLYFASFAVFSLLPMFQFVFFPLLLAFPLCLALASLLYILYVPFPLFFCLPSDLSPCYPLIPLTLSLSRLILLLSYGDEFPLPSRPLIPSLRRSAFRSLETRSYGLPRLPRASDGSTNLLVSLGSTESAITDHSLMQALSGSAPALSMVLADG